MHVLPRLKLVQEVPGRKPHFVFAVNRVNPGHAPQACEFTCLQLSYLHYITDF
jgi:hypothetical protein